MSIKFSCPKCNKSFTVKESDAGKQAKCVCGEIITVPSKSPKNKSTYADSSKICEHCSKTIGDTSEPIGGKVLCTDCRNNLKEEYYDLLDLAIAKFNSDYRWQSCDLFTKIAAEYPPLSETCQRYKYLINNPKNYMKYEYEAFPSIDLLRFTGWLILLGGIIGAIVIWANMGSNSSISGTYTELNPMGILLGFVTLFHSVLICSFLQVICLIAENIIEIKTKM